MTKKMINFLFDVTMFINIFVTGSISYYVMSNSYNLLENHEHLYIILSYITVFAVNLLLSSSSLRFLQNRCILVYIIKLKIVLSSVFAIITVALYQYLILYMDFIFVSLIMIVFIVIVVTPILQKYSIQNK